jgi:hypothetical protein
MEYKFFYIYLKIILGIYKMSQVYDSVNADIRVKIGDVWRLADENQISYKYFFSKPQIRNILSSTFNW